VNPDRGFFHCFGCKESGSAIDFVMKHDGYTFPEAVRALAERAGITIEEERRDQDAATRLRRQKEDLYAINNMAATWFEAQLREHPLRAYAEEELGRRGLEPRHEVVQSFRIGYAPPAWDGLTTFFKAQGVSPAAAEQVGLIVPRTSGTGYYDRFRHRLMFAVVDVQGRVIAFSGRALPEIENAGSGFGYGGGEGRGDKAPKYINSPESPIYTKGNALFGIYQARHAIRTSEHAIVVEGNFDVVSLHARGLANVVAPLGTAFTQDQAKLLKRFSTHATLLFDGDAAGQKAVRLSREPCREAGLSVRVSQLPGGLDPDEYARGRGIEALKELVAGARGMLEHLIDAALDASFAQADVYERAARVEQVARLIAEEQDPLVRGMVKTYADQIAARLDLHGLRVLRDDERTPEPFRALEKAVARALAASPPPAPRPQGYTQNSGDPRKARVRAKAPGSLERAAIVGAVLEFPELLDDSSIQGHLGLLEGASAQTVAAVRRSLRVGHQGEKTLDTTVFLAQIPPTIHPFASERLAAPHHETLADARGSLIENANKLRKLILAREAEEIAREQHRAAGDWEREIELAREAEGRVRARLDALSPAASVGEFSGRQFSAGGPPPDVAAGEAAEGQHDDVHGDPHGGLKHEH
jgi:DNA primase